MKDIEILDSAMKTPGWIESTMVKCGKKRCKCTKGELHGPYFYYRYWKLYHKAWIQKKRYVTKIEAEKLAKAIKKYGDLISYSCENPYRAIRKGIRSNIKNGITDMTQRRLAKVAVPVKSFA
jgi:hypothetical protein